MYSAVHEHVAGTMIFGAIHVHVHVHVPRYRYLATPGTGTALVLGTCAMAQAGGGGGGGWGTPNPNAPNIYRIYNVDQVPLPFVVRTYADGSTDGWTGRG